MTIYSWNMLFRNKRLPEALAFVRDSGADIFCLQEVPGAFLEELKALPYHIAAIKEVDFISRRQQATSYIVTLSRFPITDHHSIALPTRTKHPLIARVLYAIGLWGLAQGERHTCVAQVALPQGHTNIFNIHLSLTHPDQRAKELEISLMEHDQSVPAIVCGDFNTLEKPHINILNWLLGGKASDAVLWRRERTRVEKRFSSYELVNAFRSNHTHPLSRSQLDHILLSNHFRIESANVVPERHGSDHNPIRVELVPH